MASPFETFFVGLTDGKLRVLASADEKTGKMEGFVGWRRSAFRAWA